MGIFFGLGDGDGVENIQTKSVVSVSFSGSTPNSIRLYCKLEGLF